MCNLAYLVCMPNPKTNVYHSLRPAFYRKACVDHTTTILAFAGYGQEHARLNSAKSDGSHKMSTFVDWIFKCIKPTTFFIMIRCQSVIVERLPSKFSIKYITYIISPTPYPSRYIGFTLCRIPHIVTSSHHSPHTKPLSTTHAISFHKSTMCPVLNIFP